MNTITGSITSDSVARIMGGTMDNIPLSAKNVVINVINGDSLYFCLPPYIFNNERWTTMIYNDDLVRQPNITVNIMITYWTK